MHDEIESDPFERWHYWLRKKRVQVRVRTHLSLALAFLLAILVVCREWSELAKAALLLSPPQWILGILLIATPVFVVRFRWIYIIRQHIGVGEWLLLFAVIAAVAFCSIQYGKGLVNRVTMADGADLLELLVLIITFGTFGAAFWEFFGDKLSSSHRDAEFALHVRRLLRLLDIFYVAEPGKPLLPPRECLEQFTTAVVGAACATLCGKAAVAGGYMTPQEENSLKLWKISENANYDKELIIPLATNEPGPGPAALAYKQKEPPYYSVYLPYKDEKDDKKEAWFVADAQGEQFQFPPPKQVRWIPAKDQSLEDFRSVLCVPVRFYSGKEIGVNGGVLTVSTKRRDPFLTRDFLMAECFARILGQALAIARRLDTENQRHTQT
jgi:hypothetical protein